MAGGIDWFRWHHGSVTDPKFGLVAKKAGARLGDVLAVWAFVLESASANDERGVCGAVDFESLDFLLGMEDGTAMRILDAMTGRGLLGAGGVVTAWEKRQPKREREGDNSTERVRAFRERQRHETPRNANETPETPRGEESREEVLNAATANAVACPRPMDEDHGQPAGLQLVAPNDPAYSPPDCPHREVLELWAEVLPSMPRHSPELWRGTRADHLRARWRETAEAKRWPDKRAGLEYLRKLFAYCAQSPFLMGQTKPMTGRRPFALELEWLVAPTNWAKVIEGKYHHEEAA